MLTLKRLGWTALLIIAQPFKVLITVLLLIGVMIADFGPEFMRDLRGIWRKS